MGNKRKLHEKSIEDLLDMVVANDDLRKKVDSRLLYDIKNRNTRTVSQAKRLLALYQAEILEIKDEFL